MFFGFFKQSIGKNYAIAASPLVLLCVRVIKSSKIKLTVYVYVLQFCFANLQATRHYRRAEESKMSYTNFCWG